MNEQAKPKTRKITIELPKDLEAAYANLAFISNTPAEIVIDFAQMLPRNPKGKVVSRIIMSPIHAKMLQAVLSRNLALFEKKFGVIKIPKQPSIADKFFKPKASDEKGDEDKND